MQPNFDLISAIDDGGERGRGDETRGDVASVPRLQRGAAHHRRCLHGNSQRASAAASQDGLDDWNVVVQFNIHVSFQVFVQSFNLGRSLVLCFDFMKGRLRYFYLIVDSSIVSWASLI